MSELILPGDKGFERADWRGHDDFNRGRNDALYALRQSGKKNPAEIDFTIDQGPGDEPVSQAYVAGVKSIIPSARVVWNDGQHITVIQDV